MINHELLPIPTLFEALKLASEKHQYQRRSGYDRLPYINHLIKVADAVMQIGGVTDPDLILAALLHDIIEDTDVTEAELARRFNARVAEIVAELSDDMNLPYGIRKEHQVAGAAALSPGARIIRIADKTSNILDILHYPIEWTLEKKRYYVTNAEEIVNRIRGVNASLEGWFDQTVIQARSLLFKSKS